MTEKDVTRVRTLLSPMDPGRGVDSVPDRVDARIAALTTAGADHHEAPSTGRPPRRRLTLALAASAVAASVTAALVVTQLSDTDRSSPGSGIVVAHGSERLPSDTATDWVSYADQVVVVKLISDAEIAPSQEEEDAGEGMIGRNGTLAVEKVLWSRDQAPAVPKDVTMDLAGWVFKDGERKEFAVADTPRVETGHTYIMALARMSPGNWEPLGAGATLPYDSGVIGDGENQGFVRTSPRTTEESGDLEKKVSGQSVDDLVTLLRAARPEALALKYADLPPDERFKKVQESTGAEEGPNPDDGVDTGVEDNTDDGVSED